MRFRILEPNNQHAAITHISAPSGDTYHNDMVIRNFELLFLFYKLHLHCPVRVCFVARMMLILYISEDHQIHLIVTMRVNLHGTVLSARHVGPDCLAEIIDFWSRLVLSRSRFFWEIQLACTLTTFCLFVIYAEFPIAGEQVGVFVM